LFKIIEEWDVEKVEKTKKFYLLSVLLDFVDLD